MALPPHRLRLRRFGQAALVVFGALVAAVLGCEAVEWPFLRGPLQTRLSQALGRDVLLGGRFGVRLLGSIRAHSDRLVVGAAPAGPVLLDEAGRARPFLAATGVALELSYGALRHWLRGEQERPVVVTALDVARLDLGLVRTPDGRANWQFGAPRPAAAPGAKLPRFEHFGVAAGTLRYLDAQTRLDLGVTVRTREGRSASAARFEARARGAWKFAPVDATLESAGLLPLIAPEAQAAPQPFKLSATVGRADLALEGHVTDVLRLAGLDARFHLGAPSLAAAGAPLGLTLPATSPFQMDGRLARSGDVWRAQVARLALGTSRLDGDFRYDTAARPPALSGRLGGAHLALPDLAPALGAPPEAEAEAAPERSARRRSPDARVLPQREFDIPRLAAMTADVRIDLERFDLGTAALQSLAPLEGHIGLRDGRLRIDDLLARSAGGEVRGVFALDAGEPLAPRWKADLRWSGIDLDRFVTVRDRRRVDARARAETQRGRAPGYVTGVLGGQAQLRGTGRSAAQLADSLEGSAQLWVRDGSISHLVIEAAGIDVAESLGVLVTGDEPLPLNCAAARIVAADGVLVPEVGVIDTPDTTLQVGGKADLGAETLALTVSARPRDVTPVALRGPLHVDGTFAHPQLHLDRAAIGVRVAAAAALAAVAAPLASLLAFIDLGDPHDSACRDALERLRGNVPASKAAASAKRQRAASSGPTLRSAP